MNSLNQLPQKLLSKEISTLYHESVCQSVSDFSKNIEDIVVWNPRYLLLLLSQIQEKIAPNTILSEWFSDGTFWWSFSNFQTLVIRNGNVVFTRIADSYEHLLKISQTSNGIDDLYQTTLHHWGGNGVPTSAFDDWNESFWTWKNVVWIFEIPVKDLIQLFENSQAILWNIGEWEIVFAPQSIQKYLKDYHERNMSNTYEWLPTEIEINL